MKKGNDNREAAKKTKKRKKEHKKNSAVFVPSRLKNGSGTNLIKVKARNEHKSYGFPRTRPCNIQRNGFP
jgi:hypothetical protein